MHSILNHNFDSAFCILKGGPILYLLLLAGGGGTRLWPLSTAETPKQFIKLKGEEHSLFAGTLKRCLPFIDEKNIFVLTRDIYKENIKRECEALRIDIPDSTILCEPCSKNTLPALVNGTLEVEKRGGGNVLVLPCDHVIKENDVFAETVRNAERFCGEYIVTFGITPSSAHTGYGYIKPGQDLGGANIAERFCEKPDAETAAMFVKDGYLWNSGMFMFNSQLFMSEVKKHCADIYDDFCANASDEAFLRCRSVSIDYGLMEKSGKICVAKMPVNWSDLGGFAALYQHYAQYADQHGNVIFDNSQENCENVFIYAETQKISARDLKNTAIIENGGQTLIFNR